MASELPDNVQNTSALRWLSRAVRTEAIYKRQRIPIFPSINKQGYHAKGLGALDHDC